MLSPAQRVVKTIGGVRATARVVGCHPSAVSRWMMSKEKRGCDGRVPVRHWETLQKYCKSKNLKLTLLDLYVTY